MQLPFHENASPKVFEHARFLKKVMTRAEKILWRELRGRKFHGMKFRRQHPVAGYILDYYCHESKLVIELDGEIHNQIDISEYDKKRTEEREALGLRVIRFTNDEIINNLKIVLTKLTSLIISFSSQEKG